MRKEHGVDGLGVVGAVQRGGRGQDDGGEREVGAPLDLRPQRLRGALSGVGGRAVEGELAGGVAQHHVAPVGGAQQRVVLALVRCACAGESPHALGGGEEVVVLLPVQRSHKEVERAGLCRGTVLVQHRIQLGASLNQNPTYNRIWI